MSQKPIWNPGRPQKTEDMQGPGIYTYLYMHIHLYIYMYVYVYVKHSWWLLEVEVLAPTLGSPHSVSPLVSLCGVYGALRVQLLN